MVRAAQGESSGHHHVHGHDYKRCARQLFDETTKEEKKTRLRRKKGMCNLQKLHISSRKILRI